MFASLFSLRHNSGGPAFCDGRLVGVAFQGLDEADGVGYVIPVTIVRRVLEDFHECAARAGIVLHAFDADAESDDEENEDADGGCSTPPAVLSSSVLTSASAAHASNAAGRVVWPTMRNGPVLRLRGFARFCADTQLAESPFLRQSVNLKQRKGVIVRSVQRVSNLHEVLHEDDVLVEIDGYAISNGGNVNLPRMPPVSFEYLLSSKLVGEDVSYLVLRAGKREIIQSKAENPPTWVPRVHDKLYVPYLMFAGLVFTGVEPWSEDVEKMQVSGG